MSDLGKLMEQAWSSMEEVCSQLSPDQWDLSTDCPGWTVKDQLAHIAAIEAIALGRPPSGGDPVQAPHVRNDLGALNERELEARRPLLPEQILDEYRDVTAERSKVISGWSDAEWIEEGQGVLGKAPRERIISIRIVDVFTHEQDVRTATGNAGHLSGGVAKLVYDSMAGAMGFVFAKNAKATEGQTVVFEIGPPGETFAIGMAGGRGVRLDPIPADPTVRLAMDFETFLRLSAGRWSPEHLEKEGRLRVSGDRDLAGRILSGMNVMP